jgi:hypothetical protein
MTLHADEPPEPDAEELSEHELLLRLDLATEVLEGLDELGVETRAELEALVDRLERLISESG